MSEVNSNKNFYDILGLKEDADKDQIRKAYKKLALQWHPDKNSENKDEAEKKFKEISEAYSVLSDETKKREYDDYRKYGNRGMGGNQDFKFTKTTFNNPNFDFTDARDIFKQFFGGKDPFENFGKGFGFDDDDDVFKDMRRGFGKSPFGDDDFFKGMGSSNFMSNRMSGMGSNSGMGGMSGMSGMGHMGNHYNFGNMNMDNNNSSLQNRSGNGMGVSKKTSIRKTTQTINGRRITRIEKTIVDENGNSTTEVTEEYN